SLARALRWDSCCSRSQTPRLPPARRGFARFICRRCGRGCSERATRCLRSRNDDLRRAAPLEAAFVTWRQACRKAEQSTQSPVATRIPTGMNRRKFLRTSAILGAASRVPSLSAQEKETALAPSIAALTSMRDQAKPITNDERHARIEKARRIMSEKNFGALVLTGSASLTYFTSLRWSGGERLFACVIPVKGEPFFVCPAFEEERAMEQIARGPFGGGHADIRTWQEDESPYALVARGLD